MSRPDQEQVDSAIVILKSHILQYGMTATNARLQSTVYALHAVMTGDGKPSEAHENALKLSREQATEVAEISEAKAEKKALAADDSETADDDDDEELTHESLAAMTVEQLKDLAVEWSVELPSGALKEEIINTLLSSE